MSTVIQLTVLPTGARPRPFAALDYEEVPQSRFLDCDSYTRCLEFVAGVRWVGFSCRLCKFNCPDAVSESLDEPDESTGHEAAVIQLR